MSNLKEIIYLSNDNYKTIETEGSITIGDVTVNYDPNNMYITPIEIDDALSLESTNPVQNKVLTEALNHMVSEYAGGSVSRNDLNANYSAVYVQNRLSVGAMRHAVAQKITDNLSGAFVQRTSGGRIATTGANGVNAYAATDEDVIDQVDAKGTTDYIAWTEGVAQEIHFAATNMQYYKNGAFLASGGSNHFIEFSIHDVIDIYIDMSMGGSLYISANGTELEFEASHIKIVAFGYDTTLNGIQIISNGRKL